MRLAINKGTRARVSRRSGPRSAGIRRTGYPRPSTGDHGGLTLAELLATIAAASILAWIGTLGAARLIYSIHLPLAARRLAADLSLARANAVLRGTRAGMTFTRHTYTVHYDRGKPRETFGTLYRDVSVVSVPRRQALNCYPTGRCDNGTVVLASVAGERRSIVLNQRGRVTIRK